MKQQKVFKLTEENYKLHLPIVPLAFSYAEGGAEGDPRQVIIVDQSKTIYQFYTYELKEEFAREVLPAIFECEFGRFGEDAPANGWHNVYLGFGNHLMVNDSIFKEFNSIARKIEDPSILYQEWENIIIYGYPLTTEFGDIKAALDYIGIETSDFSLTNKMFARPIHAAIHGIGHIYRTMIGCAMLGHLLQKPREGLLAFCGAYIHDLARKSDGKEPEHGANAVIKHFGKFNHLWDKYLLTEEERIWVKQAVTQHSIREKLTLNDKGYDVMAILKDADALDRCRIGNLNPKWLRYKESLMLITKMQEIYEHTRLVNEDLSFRHFVAKVENESNRSNTQFPLKLRCGHATLHECRTYLEYKFIYEVFCKREFDKQLLLQVPLVDMANFNECERFVYDWSNLYQQHITIDEYTDIMLFQFPEPQEAGEAIYSAVVMNTENSPKYYLLEYTLDNEWIWGEYLYELEKPSGCIVRGNFNFIHNGFLKEPLLDVFLAKVVHDNALAKQIVEQLPDGWNK